MRKIISTDKAPDTIAQYSQAVIADNFVFLAGQIAISPETGQFINGEVGEQTDQVLKNLKAVLEAARTSLEKVAKITVYLTEPEHYKPMNDVYAQYFFKNPPARAAVFVKSLPKGALVEIDAIAQL